MSLETKLDTVITGLAGVQTTLGQIATAIQAQPGTNNDAVLAAIANTKAELDALTATVGTEAAPAAASATAASSALGASSTSGASK